MAGTLDHCSLWSESGEKQRVENMGNYDANINTDPRFRLTYLAALMYDMYQLFLNKGKQNQTPTGGTEKLP